MVFVQSKERAKELYRELVYDDIRVDVIHGDLTEEQVLLLHNLPILILITVPVAFCYHWFNTVDIRLAD